MSLRANPARHLERIGMQAVVAEPMIWLRDLAVEVERAADGRTARVLVAENDALPSGERPALEGAQIRAAAHGEGAVMPIAGGHTGPGGVFGFATPSELESDAIVVSVNAKGFNPRQLRLDGSSLASDPREVLYGSP